MSEGVGGKCRPPPPQTTDAQVVTLRTCPPDGHGHRRFAGLIYSRKAYFSSWGRLHSNNNVCICIDLALLWQHRRRRLLGWGVVKEWAVLPKSSFYPFQHRTFAKHQCNEGQPLWHKRCHQNNSQLNFHIVENDNSLFQSKVTCILSTTGFRKERAEDVKLE